MTTTNLFLYALGALLVGAFRVSCPLKAVPQEIVNSIISDIYETFTQTTKDDSNNHNSYALYEHSCSCASTGGK